MRRVNKNPFPKAGDTIRVDKRYRILDSRFGYFCAVGWAFENIEPYEYMNVKDAVEAVVNSTFKSDAVDHLWHCTFELIERVTTVELVTPVAEDHYKRLAEEVRIEDLIDASNLPEAIHPHYLKYHMKGGIDKNKYHYVFIVDMSGVEKWSQDLSHSEFRETFGSVNFTFWRENYRHAVSMLCKRINIRYPKVAYDDNIVVFADIKDAVYFKLQYAEIKMKSVDFKAIYSNYELTGEVAMVAF